MRNKGSVIHSKTKKKISRRWKEWIIYERGAKTINLRSWRVTNSVGGRVKEKRANSLRKWVKKVISRNRVVEIKIIARRIS